MQSISARLLTGSAIVLTIFVLLTGLSVSYSVKKRAEVALFDRLQGLVYGILGATEIENEQTVVVNDQGLPDARLNLATTGLYAEIIGNGGAQLWESTSTTQDLPRVVYSPIGEWIFERVRQDHQHDVHRMQMATVWELDTGEEIPFIVHVVADADILTGQLKRFDRTLWLSLLASAVGLLLLQLWILNRSLQPLRHIGSELQEIEQGQRQRLNEKLPQELKPLARSLNQLLKSEKNRQQQYRHLLDDLAHSLKTPLSVLKNLPFGSEDRRSPTSAVQSDRTPDEQTISEQTSQMQTTIDRYLQRAAMNTAQYLAAPVSPGPVIEKLCDSLMKIYHSPQPTFDVVIDTDFTVRLAEIDLYEILGNVLDNACKYGADHIKISSHTEPRRLIVDDNGRGFPDDLRDQLLKRGVRADTASEGQGVGLAASQSLINGYGGELELDASPDNGARVILIFS